MRSDSGYIGSFLVHLAVIGVAILFARMQPAAPREVDAQDPLLLEVWQGDGSERDPGIPGAARGIAEGVSTGDKSKMGLGAKGFTRVKVLDSGKILKEMRDAEAKAAAEAAREAKADAAKETKATKSTPDEKSSKTSAKESLADFKKANAKAGKSSASGAVSVAKSSGGSKGHAGIPGSKVGGEGTGNGSGKDGFGRPNGVGRNGGDGGSGNAEKLFTGDVRGKFADVYQPLFREQGGDLASDKDRGVVKILVSPSGLVSFAGWTKRPSDPLIERLVIESIQKMRPVRTPPGGEEIIVNIPVSGSVED